MAAVVGGRMEAVTPRRSLFGRDYLLLAVLAAVSAGVHLWLVAHTKVTARDGVGFARYALGMQSPESAGPPDPNRSAFDVVRSEKQHPGYPAAIWITAKFVRRAVELPLADSTLLAAQLVSAAASLVLIVPMYLTGRMLFDRRAAFVAVLLFQVLPVPAHITSDALTEATYLLPAVSALAVGVWAVRRGRVGGFLLCGMATGAAYLVRPEGLMVGAAVGAVVGWLGVLRVWPRDLAFGRLTALVVGIGLVASPYVILIGGKLTQKPNPGQILNPTDNPRARLLQSRLDAPANRAVQGPLFASFWTLPDDAGRIGAVWPAVSAALKETSQGLHYGGVAFALLGVIALRRRVAADPGLAVLFAFLGVNALAVILVGIRGYEVYDTRVYYVSERHVILIVLVCCFFAAVGLSECGRLLGTDPRRGRFLGIGLLGLLVATALPSTLKPLHANREGHKHAGEWLRDRLQGDDCLIDPFEWAGYYSQRTLHHIFPDPEHPEVTYVVVDDKVREDAHTRLRRMDDARAVLADGRTQLVYHWPEDVPETQAKVKVYRLVRPGGK